MIPDPALKRAEYSASAAPAEPAVCASIILVDFNNGATIGPCLESITAALDSTTGETAEVIVVDNGSSDGSPEFIAETYPWITLVRSDTNLGFGGANNLGAHQAAADLLVFVNPDTIVTPGWWQALVAPLQANESAGLATARILLADEPDRLNTAGNDVHLTGLTLCRGMGRGAAAYDQPATVSAVSGAAFAVRRDLYRRLGGFDAGYFMYMEETDLSWRAQLAGYRCVYVPESVVYHHYRLRFGPDKTFYQERNRYRLLLKTLKWPTLLLLLPALVLAEIVTWGFVMTGDRQHWTGKLRAYRSLLVEWPDIRRLRRQTQRARVVPDRALLEISNGRLDFAQTGSGRLVTLAGAVFNPLFGAWRRVVLWLVSW
jgi:GT2 family glycosyltransferase